MMFFGDFVIRDLPLKVYFEFEVTNIFFLVLKI